MKVLHVVNTPDAQSIPLELALAMRKVHSSTTVVSFYASGSDDAEVMDDIVKIDATSISDVNAIRRLSDLVRKLRPDVLHLHHTISALVSTITAVVTQPKTIIIKTEHNDHNFLSVPQFASNLLTYPFVDQVVCNSDSTLSSFRPIEKLQVKSKVTRIYNGVDLRRVRQAGRAIGPISGDPFVIGTIGRLVPQKNQSRLISAFAKAKSNVGRSVELHIIGDGPLRPLLEQTCVSQGVEGSVCFLGSMSRDQVYKHMHSWNAFVMASRFEGFCNALVEAMAIGLPLAVSDICTLHEVCPEARLRFDPLSDRDIAHKLDELCDTTRGDGAAADRFDISIAVKQHLALYEELLVSQYRGRRTGRIRGDRS